MPRPQKFEDLNTTQDTVKIGTIDLEKIAQLQNIEVLVAAQTFLDTLEQYGAELKDTGYLGHEVLMPCSLPMLKTRLKNAQSEWDDTLRFYHMALKNPLDSRLDYDFRRKEVNKFARDEGFEEIDWPQDRPGYDG